jgi:hypothetical protein
MTFRTPTDEAKKGTLARPPMAPHVLHAMVGAYVRYLSQRTGLDANTIQDRFYTERGQHAERAPADFRKWAGQKVYLMDQLRIDPFGEPA